MLAVPATAAPVEKLEGLDAALKSSCVEVQTIMVEFWHQISNLQFKLQLETLSKVHVQRAAEVK